MCAAERKREIFLYFNEIDSKIGKKSVFFPFNTLRFDGNIRITVKFQGELSQLISQADGQVHGDLDHQPLTPSRYRAAG